MKTKLILTVLVMVFLSNAKAINTINAVTKITTGSISQFEKFEIGIQLSDSYSNPYDPDVVSLEILFTSPSGKLYKIYGFYFQDFNRTATTPYWDPISTPYPWRGRFAPNETGLWQYNVKLFVSGVQTDASSMQSFTCISSSKPGFLKISPNNKYLEFDNGDSFFGFAQDMMAYTGNTPTAYSVNSCADPKPCTDFCYSNPIYYEYIDWIDNFALNGGNLGRIWMHVIYFELEWENLGNYDARQYRAYDLDKILEYAYSKGVYIELVLMNPDALAIDNVDVSPSVNGLYANPYYIDLLDHGLIGQDFFTNTEAKRFFKNKLRYINSRYGYSPVINSYEIINEVDWINHDAAVIEHNFWDEEKDNINSWLEEMATYLKAQYPSHLTTTSFAAGYKGNETWSIPSMDIINKHNYSHDLNVQYQRNYMTLEHMKIYNKPYFLTENNITLSDNCSNSDSKPYDFHNTIWAQSFSGSLSTPFYFGANVYDYNSTCYPDFDQEQNYKTISSFFENETFNSPMNFYEPIGNAYSVFFSYVPPLLLNDPLDATTYYRPDDSFLPTFDEYGYVHGWDRIGGALNTDYLSQGMETNDDRHIQTFALKSPKKILGWVGNKLNYWYELPHDAGVGICNTYDDPTYLGLIPLEDKTLTITGLRCNGLYSIEWWSTYYDWDFDADASLNDGGHIVSFDDEYESIDGEITINIPTLAPLSTDVGQESFAPDYGFKISLISEEETSNGIWNHDYTDQWDPNSGYEIDGRLSISQIDNQIFYRGTDGYLQHFYWDNYEAKWKHDGLVADWWLQNANFKVKSTGDIVIANDGNVFYRGANDRMQHYYWNGTAWVHNYTDMWDVNAAYKIDGHIAISQIDNQIFYRGVDGYLQHFYWDAGDSKWKHDGLVANWWTQDANFQVKSGGDIVIANDGNVFYQGADNRMQHYYWSGTSWVHNYTDMWDVNAGYEIDGHIAISQIDNQIFYRGVDGYLQHFYWDAGDSKWKHDGLVANWWTQDANYQVKSGGDIVIANDGNVFYCGANSRMQHYYWSGTAWVHNYTDMWDPSAGYKIGGHIAISQIDNQIFYRGTDGYIQHFYWDAGDSKWKHDGLVSDWWTQDTDFKVRSYGDVAISNDGNVFYFGNDDRVQHYFWDNPCKIGSGDRDGGEMQFKTSSSSDNNYLQIDPDINFKCYPNPTNSDLNIMYNLISSSNVKISLYNSYGIEVKTINNSSQAEGNYNMTISLDNLANGVYLIIYQLNDNVEVVEKILKISN